MNLNGKNVNFCKVLFTSVLVQGGAWNKIKKQNDNKNRKSERAGPHQFGQKGQLVKTSLDPKS